MSEPKKILIFDTTLRDGEQSPGASMTIEEKLRIAHQLEKMNVDVMEAGFPIASEGDFEAVKKIAQTIKGPQIAGLSRANDKDIDRAWEALKYAGDRGRIHTFIATSDIHMKHKLKMTEDEVVETAVKAVKRAAGYTPNVEFSAEDAVRTRLPFLARIVEAVIDAGATTVNIPDTVGYTMPNEYYDIIRYLKENVPNIERAVISVHCHNDLGLSVANSLAAIRAGAGQVECTVNGIGERAGNCSLEEVVMGLKTRQDIMPYKTDVVTEHIYATSRLLTTITGIVVQPNKAIVGANAFAHEAGIHQHGVLMEKSTYEIMTPESIGLNQNKLVLGKHSGRHAFIQRLESLGYDLSKEDIEKAFVRFKALADVKKEIFDEDLDAIVADEIIRVPERYKLLQMNVSSGSFAAPTATVQMEVDGEICKTAVIGDGPVDATFKAIKDLSGCDVRLLHFSVGAITGGTDAQGECTVRLEEQGREQLGQGAHPDIIVAAAKAYINALNKIASLQKRTPVDL
ncbi:2-isopropylmalate synthase [Desulfuromonas acetoxidans]|uniref:2-isopropylmalate synthase n=1 Tax=Desulfuromonas acetoxidans (strain DSM 684 / 11070) TaxID=281689 RepID=Q1K340_DESA6|nr:2-isopropylmalate synthase [Desulfuromonas acetoxidans]EAT16691.1 2-isopropylmalate synthase [Desulfuromonas acetoxidans DSM 684]MBF0644837.1 2-isopropylmalate synthase [Desulfuromonas acetoxidans]NVD23630.1 2-isopropylmalate synthase [Desulfuromonas acetoxidans]NVE15985.1 2-isopropylmalate synthase [Desulfuromonas acetoxidans]